MTKIPLCDRPKLNMLCNRAAKSVNDLVPLIKDEHTSLAVKFAVAWGKAAELGVTQLKCLFRPAYSPLDKQIRDAGIWAYTFEEYAKTVVSCLNKPGLIVNNSGSRPHYSPHQIPSYINSLKANFPRLTPTYDYVYNLPNLGEDTKLSLLIYLTLVYERSGGNDRLVDAIAETLIPFREITQDQLGNCAQLIGIAARFTRDCGPYHQWLKSDVKFSSVDLSELLRYIGDLSARGAYHVDVNAELTTRQIEGPNFVELNSRGVVYKAQRLVEDMWIQLGKRVTSEFVYGSVEAQAARIARATESWDEFWYSRGKWIATGSAPGFKVNRVNAVTGKEERLTTNKRMAMERMSQEYIMSILTDLSSAVTWSRHAWKYENRKRRSLWNTAPVHYLISARVLNTVEWQGTKPAWAYSYSTQTEQMRSDDYMLSKSHCAIADIDPVSSGQQYPLMYDFSDFNIYHSNAVMAAMFEEMGDILEQMRPKEYYGVAGSWLAAAVKNTYMEYQEAKVYIKSLRGLLSGTRGTALINTLCNRVYYLRALDKVLEWLRELGMETTSIMAPFMRCHGDDQAVYSHPLVCVLLCAAYSLNGQAGQASKLLFGLGEFLKYTYVDGRKSGDVVRMIPNLVASEYGASSGDLARLDLVGAANAISDVYAKAVRRNNGHRSVAIQNWLFNVRYNHDATWKTTDALNRSLTIKPDIRAARLPVISGGYGSNYPVWRPANVETPQQIIIPDLYRRLKRGMIDRGWEALRGYITSDLTALNARVTDHATAQEASLVYLTANSYANKPSNEISKDMSDAAKNYLFLSMDTKSRRPFRAVSYPLLVNRAYSGIIDTAFQSMLQQLSTEASVPSNWQHRFFGLVDLLAAVPLNPLREVLLWGLQQNAPIDWRVVLSVTMAHNTKLGQTLALALPLVATRSLPTYWLAGDLDLGMGDISNQISIHQNAICRTYALRMCEDIILSNRNFVTHHDARMLLCELVIRFENSLKLKWIHCNKANKYEFSE